MITKLLVHPDQEIQISEVDKLLTALDLTRFHPDVLWVEGDRLGVEQAKQVREHFLLKPHSAKGKVVVVVGADNFTSDAQNSLLKTLEEPPGEAQLILTASSEGALLPTVISRCETVYISSKADKKVDYDRAERFLNLDLEGRFVMIDDTEDKDLLLEELLRYYGDTLGDKPTQVENAKLVLRALEWQKSNVSVRAILEYLSLSLM